MTSLNAKKTRVAYVRLTSEDHAEISRRAQHAGLSVSEFLRRSGLQLAVPRPVPAVNRAAWSELARSTANLNQLAHHLNESRITGRAGHLDADVLREELRAMDNRIEDVRRRLIGEAPP